MKALIKFLFAKKLREYLIKMVQEAEKRGFTNGIDLPDEDIADYVLKIILGEEIAGSEKILAHQSAAVIQKMVYKDNIDLK